MYNMGERELERFIIVLFINITARTSILLSTQLNRVFLFYFQLSSFNIFIFRMLFAFHIFIKSIE